MAAYVDLSHAARPYLRREARAKGGGWHPVITSGGLLVADMDGNVVAEVVTEDPRDARLMALAPVLLSALELAYQAHDADPDTKRGRERRAAAWMAFGHVAGLLTVADDPRP